VLPPQPDFPGHASPKWRAGGNPACPPAPAKSDLTWLAVTDQSFARQQWPPSGCPTTKLLQLQRALSRGLHCLQVAHCLGTRIAFLIVASIFSSFTDTTVAYREISCFGTRIPYCYQYIIYFLIPTLPLHTVAYRVLAHVFRIVSIIIIYIVYWN